MLALNNLSKYEKEKTTKILKPLLIVLNDYLVILLLTVSIFVGGVELASGRYVCVPVVHCSTSNNASTLLSKIKYHNVCRVLYSSQKSTDTKGKAITVATKFKYARYYDYVNSECKKTAFPWFHSYFSLLLFCQAFILLLVNNLWLKYPRTASTVNNFYALADECYNLPHFASLASEKDHESEPNSCTEQTELIPKIASSDSQQNIECVRCDLATAIAAKTLYEKIRRFNDYAGTSKQIQYLYLLQTVLQVLLTVIFFTFNLGFKDIKGTAKCSVDEYFSVIYDYFTCSHNLSTLLEIALVLFLIILAVLFFVCMTMLLWTNVFMIKRYYFKDKLKGWRLPTDLKLAQRDMGFLLHLLHAYDELYSVQFAIYMSEDLNRKFKKVILDNEWPVERLERCFYKDNTGRPTSLCLSGLSAIPNALFHLAECIIELKDLHLNGCGPLQDYDFDQFATGFFENLQSLTLANCGLTKIPKELFELRKLGRLCLKNNSIQEIQREISSLKHLCQIDISYNNLETIDGSIKTLQNLRIFNISNNPKVTKPEHVSAITNVLECEQLKTLIVSDFPTILRLLPSEEHRKKFTEVANKNNSTEYSRGPFTIQSKAAISNILMPGSPFASYPFANARK